MNTSTNSPKQKSPQTVFERPKDIKAQVYPVPLQHIWYSKYDHMSVVKIT